MPALIPAQSELVPIRVGTDLKEPLLPSPSWPSPFAPHAQIVPSARRARLKKPPAPTSTHADSVPTRVGILMFVPLLPRPSWPKSFPPHAHRVPSRCSASVWVAPAATWNQFDSLPTRTGMTCGAVVEPMPSWPLVFNPHAHNVPFVWMPRENPAS